MFARSESISAIRFTWTGSKNVATGGDNVEAVGQLLSTTADDLPSGGFTGGVAQTFPESDAFPGPSRDLAVSLGNSTLGAVLDALCCRSARCRIPRFAM